MRTSQYFGPLQQAVQ